MPISRFVLYFSQHADCKLTETSVGHLTEAF